MTNRILKAGPGRRDARLIEEPLAPAPDGGGCALIRNHWTMIYPGVEVDLIQRAEREERWFDLGRLAIGEVIEPAPSGPRAGQIVYWSGPHADYARLDPARHVWTPIDRIDPLLLPAGIGAEAQVGLTRAIAELGEPPRHAIVVGAGLLGHLGAQWLRLGGASVTVVENSPKRLEFCKYLGLTERVDTHNLRWLDRVKKWNPGGVELLVDAAGLPGVFPALTELLVPGGVLCRLGNWRPESMPAEVTATLEAKGARLAGPRETFGDSPGHGDALAAWIDSIASGRIATERLITHRVPAAESPMALKRFAAGIRSWLGAAIHWTEER